MVRNQRKLVKSYVSTCSFRQNFILNSNNKKKRNKIQKNPKKETQRTVIPFIQRNSNSATSPHRLKTRGCIIATDSLRQTAACRAGVNRATFIGIPKGRNRNVHESIGERRLSERGRGRVPGEIKSGSCRERWASARGVEQLGRNSVHAVELSSRGKKRRLLSFCCASENAWPGISACFHRFFPSLPPPPPPPSLPLSLFPRDAGMSRLRENTSSGHAQLKSFHSDFRRSFATFSAKGSKKGGGGAAPLPKCSRGLIEVSNAHR